MADTGAPGFIPLASGSDQFSPPQAPLNALATALNTALSKTAFNTYDTKAHLDAAPGTVVGQHASVNADTTAANNGDYRWSGSAWLLYQGFIGASMKRSGSAATFTASTWTQLTNAAYWATDQPASGMNAFNGTFVAPIAGVYDVRAGIQLDTTVNAILALKKNDSTGSSTGSIAQSTTIGFANDTAVALSKLVRLNAGDYVAAAVYVSATAVWNTALPDTSFFSIRYVEPQR